MYLNDDRPQDGISIFQAAAFTMAAALALLVVAAVVIVVFSLTQERASMPPARLDFPFESDRALARLTLPVAPKETK